MTDAGAFLVGVVIAIGLAGVVIPVLPGSFLVLAAILIWAVVQGGAAGLLVATSALLFIGGAQVFKYTVPSKNLRRGGIPNSTVAAGGILGIVGFFVIPVVGLVLGFVLGVYVAEWRRLDDQAAAWPSTILALKAVGISILIELAGALAASAAWIAGVLAVQ